MINIFAADNTCRVLTYKNLTMQHMYHLSVQFITVYLSLWKGQQRELSLQTQSGTHACAGVKLSYLTEPFHDSIDRQIAGGRE